MLINTLFLACTVANALNDTDILGIHSEILETLSDLQPTELMLDRYDTVLVHDIFTYGVPHQDYLRAIGECFMDDEIAVQIQEAILNIVNNDELKTVRI